MGTALVVAERRDVVPVPVEYWYRFEDVRYAAPLNEYDEPSGPGQLAVELRKYLVSRYTPKGVWLSYFFKGARDRFVLSSATKRFACATIEDARTSFIARKTKQARILQARADNARAAIEIVKREKYNA